MGEQQLLATIEEQWPHVQEILGIGADHDSLISAAAVGLVEKAWRDRDGPVEDAHGSGSGPSDGEMMAESLHLYAVARDILDRGAEFPFLDFERQVLDVDRLWSGTSRTVKSMLFGHLGEFRKQVKATVNTLGGIDTAEGRDVVLRYLCLRTMFSGGQHFGMPHWEQVVDHVVAHLRRPTDPCWLGGDYELATGRLPHRYVDEPAEFGAVLRRDPGCLGPEVLDDLIVSGAFSVPTELARRPGCVGAATE